MKLKLKNVGRIKEAEILVDGITVICGDNNTGKSTVGKVLYCIYSAFHDLQRSIRRERIDSIMKSIFHRSYFGFRIEALEKALGSLVDSETPTVEQIKDTIVLLSRENDNDLVKEPTNVLVERVQKLLSVDEDDIANAFMRQAILSEFGGKLANVNTSARKADVTLELREGNIAFHTTGKSQKLVLDHYFSLEKRLIYIDDPFVLDEADMVRVIYRNRRINHRDVLAGLISSSVDHEHANTIEGILHDREVKAIIHKMDEVSNGSLVKKEGSIYYKHAGLDEDLDLMSVSTGIKTFTILKTLLMSGYLENNGIMVLDEPEVHLHPEWQIKLAEIIVMLQKTYGLNAIITTHSNDFLFALDYYSKEYNIRSICHFYLTEMEKNTKQGFLPKVTIKEKTNDMESMFASVSDPYLNLYSRAKGV